MTALQKMTVFITWLSVGIVQPIFSLLLLGKGAILTTLPAAIGVYSITVLTAEFPSGVFADIFGRKAAFMFVYVFSGVMGSLAGMVLCARSYSGNPVAGNGAEMDAIAAVVLGGASMAGGYGYIGGTMIGALIIGLLNNGLNLMRIDSYWQIILKGVVILVAVYVDYVKNLKKNKSN